MTNIQILPQLEMAHLLEPVGSHSGEKMARPKGVSSSVSSTYPCTFFIWGWRSRIKTF
jgi:hypothetical protein